MRLMKKMKKFSDITEKEVLEFSEIKENELSHIMGYLFKGLFKQISLQ